MPKKVHSSNRRGNCGPGYYQSANSRIQILILVSSFWLRPALLGAATFNVTSKSDSGPGSLRQAILNANAANDLDTVQFLIPGTRPFTISILSPLPPLSAPVQIDATTQPGYAGSPIIELNGASAGVGTAGLRVTGGGCTIRGLAINRFSADGIRLDSGNNVIRGNYIGTDVTGTLARGNGQIGVFVLGTSTNVIGGTNLADRNVISGRNDTGIYVLSGRANVIQGNYIGLNAAGTADLGNTNNGIVLYGAPANLVGGTAPGARNVISGNAGSGINVNLASATDNWILGNYIGVNAAGTAAIGNRADGITLNNAPANLIGGTDAGAMNLISGNGQSGIFLNGTGTRSNLIAGNLIGTEATGAAALGNGLAGVTLLNAASNRIGNPILESRNVISGNRQAGILLSTNSNANQIQNNFIGVAANGTNALGNAFDGIAVSNGVLNQIVSPGAGNVISGNSNNGVLIFGRGASNNFVQGNHIGTDMSGSTAVKNAASGVRIESAANQIGGGTTGDGNLISGNGLVGVWLLNSGAAGNFIRGNLVGTAAGGTNGLGNAFGGIGLTDAASNQIGGLTIAERNLVSANGFPENNGGIFVLGEHAQGNRISGNFIGTDIHGQSALPNRFEGIYVAGANGNVIGSELPGGGNLISGNTTRGIRITNSVGGVIRGNFIGTKADGVSALPNAHFGVELEENSSGNILGGASAGAGNRIGFNGGSIYAGIRVRDSSTNNSILGNAIFANGALGIDLGNAGVTTNDSCDGDGGGNLLQNFPVLTEAYSAAFTTVRGVLNSRANTLFRLQFFFSTSCDASGSGEGQVYLGDMFVTTDSACSARFTAFLPVAVPPGNLIAATATDSGNNTSEFSDCSLVRVFPASPLLAIRLAGNQISIAWTNTATCFELRETHSLSVPIQWRTVTNAPVGTNGQFLVTLPGQAGTHFYQLYSPCAALPPSPLLELRSGADDQISLAWPTTATGFVLQETGSFSAPIQWARLTNTPAITDGQFLVTLPRQPGNRFYRLSFE